MRGEVVKKRKMRMTVIIQRRIRLLGQELIVFYTLFGRVVSFTMLIATTYPNISRQPSRTWSKWFQHVLHQRSSSVDPDDLDDLPETAQRAPAKKRIARNLLNPKREVVTTKTHDIHG